MYVCHDGEPGKRGWTDRDDVWVCTGGLKQPPLGEGPDSPTGGALLGNRCIWRTSTLIANRMAPSRWMDPCGMRWGSWFQAIRYHISATYLVSMQSAYFLKCRIKLTCLTSFVCICLWVQCNCRVCIFDAVCDCATILVQELCWHCSLLLL